VVASPTIAGFLKKHQSIFIDTSAFIYFVEERSRYFPLCERLFSSIEAGAIKASTSTLTLLEVLVQPYRLKRDDLILKFYSLLTTYPNLTWIPMTTDVADYAAKIRAEYRLKTPDAIQAASAIATGATGFVCNDKIFEKVANFESLVIDNYTRPSL
jgi:predicted nucleic acid-binding protein